MQRGFSATAEPLVNFTFDSLQRRLVAGCNLQGTPVGFVYQQLGQCLAHSAQIVQDASCSHFISKGETMATSDLKMFWITVYEEPCYFY